MPKLQSDGVNKFGSNPDIDTAAEESIWANGGLYVWPTAARIHDIVSDSTDDAAAGTGARTVFIEGIGADGKEQTETVTLNGTTDVPTTKTWLAINRMVVLTAGTGGKNAGVITATAQTDSTVSANIAIGINQTQLACFMVPNDKDLFLDS